MPVTSSAQTSAPLHEIVYANVPTASGILQARLNIPATADGWVISGYSRRYRHFAMPDDSFGNTGLATMHLQLLSPPEPSALLDSKTLTCLTHQLIDATYWLQNRLNISGKPVGLFGAYQDAGVALSATAFLGSEVKAVVSWQGRPDKSMNHLDDITAPTLLLANPSDEPNFIANVQARWWLRCVHQLVLVPGRLRLLRERSSFQMVNRVAGDWYRRHLLGRKPLKSFPSQLLIPNNSYEWSGALLQ